MNALRTLLQGIVDYAGLFPPAGLPMQAAVQNYATYRLGETAWALGRFILPVGQLAHFEEIASEFLPRGASANPWRLSVLASEDLRADIEAIKEFNQRHNLNAQAGSALIDSIEFKTAAAEQIEAIKRTLPELVQPYFELPIVDDPRPIIAVLRTVGGRAKVRTGGTTVDMFPSTANLLRFITACVEASVPFKATAGLHHPLRSAHPLTYEADSPLMTMFGFLNVFITAALLRSGVSIEEAFEALEEASPAAFHFGDNSLHWRSYSISLDALSETRSYTALSFGSCSFSEPIDGLKALDLL